MLLSSLTDAAAIAANKRGEITRAQTLVLQTQWHLLVWPLAIMAVLATAFVVSTALRANDPLVAVILAAVFVIIGAVTAAHFWPLLSCLRRARQEAETGPIYVVAGEMVRQGREYSARSGGRKLRLNPLSALPPGNYRFYILPDSGWVLSAEPLADAETSATGVRERDRALARALGTSSDVLALNRDQRLAGKQVPIVLRALFRAAGTAVSRWLLPAALFLYVAAMITRQSRLSTVSTVVEALICVLLGGLSAWLLLNSLWHCLGMLMDLYARRVVSDEGAVKTWGLAAKRNAFYYCILHGHYFDVSREVYEALLPGRLYRLYYTRYGKVLVGAEHIIGSGAQNTLTFARDPVRNA